MSRFKCPKCEGNQYSANPSEGTGCINRIAVGAPEARYLVIEEPINETGICRVKEFKTEAEAQEFIREQGREKQC